MINRVGPPVLRAILPAVSRGTFPVSRGQAAAVLTRLLGEHSVVVLSGADTQSENENRQIGKTTLVIQQLIPSWEEMGKQATYCNLQKLLSIRTSCRIGQPVFLQNISTVLEALPDVELYVFDEVHHFFPLQFGTDDNAYNQMQIFWRKIEALSAAGKNILFVTSMHPQNDRYRLRERGGIMGIFFSAPVVELERESDV